MSANKADLNWLGPFRVWAAAGREGSALMGTLPDVLRLAAMENNDLSIVKQPGFWIAVAVGIAPVVLYAAVILYLAAR